MGGGIPSDRCIVGRGPDVGRQGHGQGQQIILVGEQGEPRRVMGGRIGGIRSPELQDCDRQWVPYLNRGQDVLL